MTALPAKVIALEKPGDHYRRSSRSIGSTGAPFDTTRFWRDQPHSGSLNDGRLNPAREPIAVGESIPGIIADAADTLGRDRKEFLVEQITAEQ